MSEGPQFDLSNLEVRIDDEWKPLGKAKDILVNETKELLNTYEKISSLGENGVEAVIPLRNEKIIFRRTPIGRKTYKLKLLNPILQLIQKEIESKIKEENNGEDIINKSRRN